MAHFITFSCHQAGVRTIRRSGSTLAEQILCSHPDVQGGGERNEIVHVQASDVDPTGRVVRVRIEQAFNNSLFGIDAIYTF